MNSRRSASAERVSGARRVGPGVFISPAPPGPCSATHDLQREPDDRSGLKPRTWNAEPGTRNLERGTWNAEPGTRNTVKGAVPGLTPFSAAIRPEDPTPFTKWPLFIRRGNLFSGYFSLGAGSPSLLMKPNTGQERGTARGEVSLLRRRVGREYRPPPPPTTDVYS